MALSRESVSDRSMLFGQIRGSDYTLISWEDTCEWFLMVQESSTCMAVQPLGTATEGAPMDLLIINSEGATRDLEGLRRQREPLSDIGLLSDPGNVGRTGGGQKPVILIMPALNPDGMQSVQEWYERTRDTPAEGTDSTSMPVSPLRLP